MAITRSTFLRGSLAATAAAVLPDCCTRCPPEPESPGDFWFNAAGTLEALPHEILQPGSLKELVEVVQRAEREGLRVRAVGSGHSYSDITISSGLMVVTSEMNRVLQVGTTLPARPGRVMCRVECGVRICELNQALDEAGLALENMGGYDGQTLVGAISTGTHGSGLGYGPFASWVESMDVVTTGGEVWRVEPSNGISPGPSGSRISVETPEGPVEGRVKKDDDLFQSLAVSMGCMGIVYAATFRVVTKFWLHEKRTVVGWRALTRPDGVLERLTRSQPPACEHYEILVNPYSEGDDHQCLLTERTRLSRPTRPEKELNNPRKSDFLPSLEVALGASESGLVDVVNLLDKRALTRLISGTLRMMREEGKGEYESLSYNVFHLGAANDVGAWAIELCFSIRESIRAVERIFEIAKNEAESFQRYHPSPISLRFVQGAEAYLAPQHGRDSCMIEIGSLLGMRGAEKHFRRYELELIGGDPPVRPHWGLDLSVLRGKEVLQRLYPKWPVWERAYRDMNRRGTFNGKFTDRHGISVGT